MRTIFTLILSLTLTFTHVDALFDSTPQKVAGGTVLTVVVVGILYLVKSTNDVIQQAAKLEELLAKHEAKHEAKMKMRQEALQNFKEADAKAIQALHKISAKLQIAEQAATQASASPLQAEPQQEAVTSEDLESLIKYGQAREKLQMLLDAAKSDFSKQSPAVK